MERTSKKPQGKVVKSRYVEAVGRRKTSVARVRLVKGKGAIHVNGMPYESYFRILRYRAAAEAPLRETKTRTDFDVEARVSGGGPTGQAEAVRHGIARALVITLPDLKKQLRRLGFLTRDPRMVERKKYGLKKARRAPQWSKR